MRTDVHSPKNLVTEDYEYIDSLDLHPEDGNQGDVNQHLKDLGLLDSWAENESAGSCYHCGARARYVGVLLHKPTGQLILVGEQCLGNRFSRSTQEFQELRKQAQLARENHRIKAIREAWFAVDEDRKIAYEWASAKVAEGDYGYEGLRHKFVHQINRYGSVSDKFVRAIRRDEVRSERRAEEQAARDALRRPVVEGRIEVTGEVVSVKFQDNDFGGRLVQTVKDDRGFLVWGTVPSAISGVEKGQRVAFTATVEKSDRDECFGFYSRPSKARFLDS